MIFPAGKVTNITLILYFAGPRIRTIKQCIVNLYRKEHGSFLLLLTNKGRLHLTFSLPKWRTTNLNLLALAYGITSMIAAMWITLFVYILLST